MDEEDWMGLSFLPFEQIEKLINCKHEDESIGEFLESHGIKVPGECNDCCNDSNSAEEDDEVGIKNFGSSSKIFNAPRSGTP
jgi:hypothetical protein